MLRHLRFFVVAVVATLAALAVTPVAAGTISYPPSITYGQRAALTVSGLAPNTAYRLVVYAPGLVPNASFPFTSQADGSYALPGLGPQPTDQTGGYIVAVQSADNTTTVASATVVLTGTNTYYVTTRLGG